MSNPNSINNAQSISPNNAEPINNPKQIEKVKNETQQLQNDTANVLNKVTSLINEVKSNISSSQTSRTTSIENLKTRVNDILSNLNTLQQASADNEANLRDSKRKLGELLRQKEADLNEKKRVLEQLSQTKLLVDSQKGEISKLKEATDVQQITKLKAEIDGLKDQVRIKGNQINEMKNMSKTDSSAYDQQIKDLENVLGNLNELKVQVEGQGKSIDNTFNNFDDKLGQTESPLDNLGKTIESVGNGIANMFTFGGGKKKKSLKYHKKSRASLEKIGKKWGIKKLKKYKTKKELIIALTLIVIYKTKGKIYTKKDLIVVAKNLDIKVHNKMTKAELKSKIEKKIRRFSFRDLY